MGMFLLYSWRNLLTRRLTTILTSLGMCLVVFVFASIMMLSEGLKQTLVDTGLYDNIIVVRKGATSEVQSIIERHHASILETQKEIAMGVAGKPLVAKELVVLVSLNKRDSDKPSNVVIRGIDESSLVLRPQIKIVEGRLPRPGTSEIMTGINIAQRFKGAGIEESLTFALRSWKVVGIFDAGKTGFSSEVWADVDQLMSAFRRHVYSSIIFKLKDPSEFDKVKGAIESDPRLTVEAKREITYYADQSEAMASFLRILGLSLTIIFSLGAVIGAMITMYAAVANRIGEIGTLRALGFQKKSILMAFLMESVLISLIGGILGLVLSSFLQFITVSTMNFQTFSELAFSFSLTYEIAIMSIGFSIIMGFIGGVLPALRASRMKIVDSLR
ncbi:MAG: ABC transporter permease, partial [Thermodesulfovibrionales bacterium]|nr:ABC transporter permease [Thermodesulfovibrionales bacterium]